MRQACTGKRGHEEDRPEVRRRVTALMGEGRQSDDRDPEGALLGFRSSPRTMPLRRSISAISTGAVRGQVPEREAPGPSKNFWRVRPSGRTSTITKPPEVLVSRSGDLTT